MTETQRETLLAQLADRALNAIANDDRLRAAHTLALFDLADAIRSTRVPVQEGIGALVVCQRCGTSMEDDPERAKLWAAHGALWRCPDCAAIGKPSSLA